MKPNSFVTALLVGAGALVLDTVASAADSPAAGTDTLEEIVVTGSRVITNGNNSPTPVTVVDAQELLSVRPGTIADALNSLPVFSGSNVAVSNPNPGIGAGGGGNGARSSFNLRNLGEARTLVLLDGHRVPSTTSTNVVDADMIPQMMIKRVDLVTGGTSAVYGSDAIAGVINFVTDRDFNGFKANAQTGVSAREDDRQYQAGVAWGAQLGKAHVEASYEYHFDDGIPYRSARAQNWQCGMIGNGTTIPYSTACGLRRFDATFGGTIRNGALINQQFVAPGVLAPFVSTGTNAVTGSTQVAIGGDGGSLDASLKASLRSHQLFGRLDYDFSDNLHGYVELAGNKKENGFYSGWFTISNLNISRTNAFLPTAISSLIPTTQASFQFGKFVNGDTRLNSQVKETQLFTMAGLEGKLGEYDWTVGLVHGDAKLDNTNVNNTNNFRLRAALDAVTDSTGKVVCRVTLTPSTAALFPGCVPLNVFGPGSESPAALAYVLGNTNYVGKTKQDELSGSISGKLFNTWAGPFVAALSGEWRRQTFSSVSGMLPVDAANTANLTSCTTLGLVFDCNSLLAEWGNTFASRSAVSQTVKEGAFEFDAPLLKDLPLAKQVSLNGAVRYTNYDTSGSSTTWKLGIDWHLNDSWRIRGTKSRDIRAPTLDDLFSPSVGQTQNVTDRLLGVQNTTAYRYLVGTPNLTAEVGHTTTAGIVWQPQSAPGFSMSVDAFNIEVTNAIYLFTGTDNTTQDTCYTSGGTSPACDLQSRALGNFSRVPANVVTAWYQKPLNIASVHTWGGDLELNWSTRVGTHPLVLRGMLTYQPHLKYFRSFLPTLDQGGVAYGAGGLQAAPSTRATLQIRYGFTERLVADLQTRYRNSLAMLGDPSVTTNGVPIPGATFTSLNVNYRLPVGASTMDLFINVQNLLNSGPPAANFYGTLPNVGQFGGFAVGDDPIGRYYMAGLRFRL
jgi:outer membrane receptor protein involved in Fe transport